MWNDDSLQGEGAVITVNFSDAYQMEQIIVYNLVDETRFLRNYRVSSYQITTNDNSQGVFGIIPDQPGNHPITFRSLNTTQITFQVEATYFAEEVDGVVFDELVIQEIEFYGRPVP